MDKENTLYIDLKDGRVVVELRPDLAPKHVTQIKKLAREGKYDGVVFHRVIDGFMAQTGDPTGTGSGGMGELLNAEFSKEPHSLLQRFRAAIGEGRGFHRGTIADAVARVR